MKIFLKRTVFFMCALTLVLGLVGCPTEPKNNNIGGGTEKPDVEESTTSFSGEFAGLKWELASDYTASVGIETGKLVVTNNNSDKKNEGIALYLADESLAAIQDILGTNKFFVEAKVMPTAFGQGKNNNFGVASHISDSAFYYAGINYNGRGQIGSKAKVKGQQFGSLISDTTLLKDNWKQPYTIRYIYNDGKISGYINGIQMNKSGITEWTADGTATNGNIGIYTNGDSFELYSFKVGTLDKPYQNLKLKTDDTSFATLSENADAYVFLPTSDLELRIGASPIDFEVLAFGEAENTDFSVESSNPDIVAVSKSETGFSMSFEAEGTSTVTVKHGTDSSIEKKINVTVLEKLPETDTDYEKDSAFYPTPGATGIFEDDRLVIEFDSEPTLVEGSIDIYNYETNELVDSIKIGAETNEISDGVNSNKFTLKNFMVQKDGNKVFIIPHFGKLEAGTKYYVVIGDGVITGTLNNKTFTGFASANKRWTFTTRDAYTPANTTALKVSQTAADADYRTLQAALCVAEDGAAITVDPGVYREIIYDKKARAVTIVGNTEKEFGSDVVIQGINCNAYNGSSHTRASFYWSGSDLTLKNITIQNAYDRNVDGTAQSEAIYFANGVGKKLVAYNCSFKGFQDTIQTSGKNWFYKCYIEGDTDFIWGTADVALFEECTLKMLDTTGNEVKASEAYIFETRVGSTSANLVPKGYVLFKSNVTAEHPLSYFGRRASGKSSTSYYDNAAVIDSTFAGNLNAELWGGPNVKSDKNEPEFIAKDANGNMNVGWKSYGGSGFSLEKINAYPYIGTITEEVYNAEYSSRNVILNKVFNKTTGAYDVADEIWDVSDFATEFGAPEDTTEVRPTVNQTIYDFASIDPTNTDGLTATGISWNQSKYALGSSAGAELKIAVTGNCYVTVSYCYEANATISIGSQKVKGFSTTSGSTSNIEEVIFTNASGAGDVVISCLGRTFITKLKVVYDDTITAEETAKVESVTVKGSSVVTVGNTIELVADVVSTYIDDKEVTWSSSDDLIATVDVNGVVTGFAAGTATITATSTIDSTKSGSIDIEVSAEPFDATNATVSIDLSSSDINIQSKKGTIPFTVKGSTDYDLTAYVDATTTSGKLAGDGTKHAQMNAGTVIKVPVSDGAVVSVTASSAGAQYALYTIAGTAASTTELTSTYTHSGDATWIDIISTGTAYPAAIEITGLNLENNFYGMDDYIWTQVSFASKSTEDTKFGFEGNVGEFYGLVIDATRGKYKDNGSGWIQFNTGTIVYVPVIADATIVVSAYDKGYSITGGEATALTDNGDKTYTYNFVYETDAVEVEGYDGKFAKLTMVTSGYWGDISLEY